jgi:hypothetical protein
MFICFNLTITFVCFKNSVLLYSRVGAGFPELESQKMLRLRNTCQNCKIPFKKFVSAANGAKNISLNYIVLTTLLNTLNSNRVNVIPILSKVGIGIQRLTPASAFRHTSSQSGTGSKKYRTIVLYSGTRAVPASLSQTDRILNSPVIRYFCLLLGTVL